MRSKSILFILAVAISTLAAAPSQAVQEAATLSVRVTEEEGVVPGAVVLLTRQEGRAMRRITNEFGVATFGDLAPGTYDLKVTYIGFAPFEQRGISIAAGQSKSIDARLTLIQFSAEVTVTTATRREELLRNVAEPTTLIDLSEIEDTGGRTAKDVLVEQAGSGVLVNAGGGQGHVSINGISNSGVLILIDGRRWLGRNSLGDVNFEDLDLSQFERIEIIKGAGSALYGSDALAGVINFITRKSPDFGFSNSLSLNFGSHNDARFSDTFGFNSEKARGRLTASYRTYDGFDLDEDNPQTIGQPKSRFYTLGGNAEFEVADNIVARLFADYSRRDISNYFFSGPTQLGIQVYDSQRETTRYTLSPELDVFLGSNTALNLSLNYSKYNREEDRIYPTFSEKQFPWQEWNTEFKATGKHTLEAFGQDHYLQAGYEFRNEKMDRANLIFPGTSETEADRDINVVWFQGELNLTPQFKFTGGFRYDDYSDFGNEFSPKLSAVYALTEEHRVRFSYGHGFRAPRFGELYLDLGFFFKGNPDLLPEKSDNFTVGYSLTNPVVQGSFDFFWNRVEDGIVFDFSAFPFGPVSYTNLQKFTATGFNSSMSVDLPGGFTSSFSYSYVKREDDEGEEILSYPKNSGFFKILWSNPRLGIRANLRAQLLDKVEYDDGASQPSYQVWYLKGSKRLFRTENYAFSAFAQVDNLFGKEDIFLRDESGNPVPGDFQVWLAPRTFLVGITIDMDWFGIR